MNASLFPSRRRHTRIAIAFFATILGLCVSAGAQRKAAAPDPDKPKIRAITAFVNLDRTQYQPQIEDALKMLKYARTVFESRGFEVQTIRISTQPFPQYTKGLTTEQALAFFRNYDAVAEQDKFDASIGPAMLNVDDSEAQADLLAEILKNTKVLNASLVVAGEDGVRWRAVGAAARVMKKLEDTEHSQGNFRFSAIAMVPPLTPFYPGSYHSGFGHQFAIALESANVVAAAFKNAPICAPPSRNLPNRSPRLPLTSKPKPSASTATPAGPTWESICRPHPRKMYRSARHWKI